MKFRKFIPTMYQKNITSINYEKLKSSGIRCILFDLDNTLLKKGDKKLEEKIEKKLILLKKNFKIIIISNNFKRKISKICSIIDVDFVSFSRKPFTFGFKKVTSRYNLKKEEICIIGDQLVSDILGGNRYGIKTILVDPLGEKDLKITKVNRILETFIFNSLKKQGVLERGIYYE